MVGLILLFAVVAEGLAIGLVGPHTATAGLFGRMEVQRINQSAGNRTVQQAGFETAWADIRKYDQQVQDAAKSLADWDKTNVGWQARDNAIGTLGQQRNYLSQALSGLRQQCQNTVETYNADARKTLAMDWRAADLPEQISLTEHCR